MQMKRTLSRLAIGAVVGLALCACAAAPAATEIVRPITDIVASPPEFTDIGPNSVTLLLQTSVPVACSVVYGTTSDYGQLATDTDMAGGAHSNHHPLLTGLTPDTTYYARFQGAAPDGTLYRSDEYTFHTAPAPDTSGEPNLASLAAGAKLVGVSSTYGGGPDDGPWGGLNALDGDGATAWSSNGDGDNAWIEIELAATTHVTQVGFWSRTMGSSAEIHSFQIVTDRGETIGPFELSGAGQADLFDTDFTARSLRFEAVTSSGGNTGAVEIVVHGEPQG